jgi:hypothetical protein
MDRGLTGIFLEPASTPQSNFWKKISMDINASASYKSINTSMLTPIVRQSLGRDTFNILDWHVTQMGGGIGNPVSVGLYLFEGFGQDQDESIAWSVILKILQSPANMGFVNMGEGDNQNHWNYWKREPMIYQSDLLQTLPGGMAAPRCYGVAEQPGNIVWLWLENIVDSYGGNWPLERYALTARHLGQLNGIYISERPLPSFPWLSLNRTRNWLGAIPIQTIPWEHPRILDHYPRPEVNSFKRMLGENDRFLAKLELLPKTMCHGDTYPTNFKSRHMPKGLEQTVALDWALAGIAPLGDDLGQLVLGAQTNLKGVQRLDIDKTLFNSYLDGLRDSNCHVEPQQVRFGYTASAALRVGLFHLLLMNQEPINGETVSEPVVEHPDIPDCFEVVMADEAYMLLDVMR